MNVGPVDGATTPGTQGFGSFPFQVLKLQKPRFGADRYADKGIMDLLQLWENRIAQLQHQVKHNGLNVDTVEKIKHQIFYDESICEALRTVLTPRKTVILAIQVTIQWLQKWFEKQLSLFPWSKLSHL